MSWVRHGDALTRESGDAPLTEAVVCGAIEQLPERMAALCDYACKLTLEPAAMQERDLEPLRGLGLDDRAIVDANQVVAYFNYVNRIAEGLGVDLAADRRWRVLASIPSPADNGIHLGPLFVHAYGLAYIVGVIAAVAITSRRWERQGGSRELVQEVALWGFPAGLIGGRLYFLATSWNEVPDHWWGPLAIWKGGLGIWGGIALGTLGGLFVLRRRGADIPRFMDAAAPGLLVAQAIGRIGNYFNQELFGGPTSLPWALRIDPSHRPSAYEHFTTFHPTFLYELIWNLALAGALIWLGHRRPIRAPGLFALYVAGYSGFRIFEELLRVDPAHHILGLRLNLFVAALFCAAGLLWFARIQRGSDVTVVRRRLNVSASSSTMRPSPGRGS